MLNIKSKGKVYTKQNKNIWLNERLLLITLWDMK